MEYPKIRLAYRTVIDNTAANDWERFIFEDTYREYCIQQQLYNNKENPLPTFRELLAENPAAENLHFLTGMAADSYVAQLKGSYYKVPDILGANFFPVAGYRLDIVNTDITDSSRHKVGITLFSEMLSYLGTVNDCYLVSKNTGEQQGFDTTMFPLQPKLAICYYEEPGR